MKNSNFVRLCKQSSGCILAGGIGLMLATPAFADADSDIAALRQKLGEQQAQIEALMKSQEATFY